MTPLALPIWRCHRAGYPADSAGGSLRISGRFHKATDTSPAHETWPALYSACSAAIALGEVVRNIQDDFSNRLVDLHMSKMDARFSGCSSPMIKRITNLNTCLDSISTRCAEPSTIRLRRNLLACPGKSLRQSLYHHARASRKETWSSSPIASMPIHDHGR